MMRELNPQDPEKPMPLIWWVSVGFLAAVTMIVMAVKLLGGEGLGEATGGLTGVLIIVAAPLVAREWQRFRRSRSPGN